MARIILTYDARNTIAKKTLDYLLSLGLFKVEQAEKPRYNAETEKAIKEVKQGKATSISLEDFRKQLYS